MLITDFVVDSHGKRFQIGVRTGYMFEVRGKVQLMDIHVCLATTREAACMVVEALEQAAVRGGDKEPAGSGEGKVETVAKETELHRRFSMMARHTRAIAETMLSEHFGERCPDFEPTCLCCERWLKLDELTLNPYDDPATVKQARQDDREGQASPYDAGYRRK